MVFLLTSLISSWYLYLGFRQKNVGKCLVGIGFAIPSLGISNLDFWAIGAGLCIAGIWLQRFLDGM